MNFSKDVSMCVCTWKVNCYRGEGKERKRQKREEEIEGEGERERVRERKKSFICGFTPLVDQAPFWSQELHLVVLPTQQATKTWTIICCLFINISRMSYWRHSHMRCQCHKWWFNVLYHNTSNKLWIFSYCDMLSPILSCSVN